MYNVILLEFVEMKMFKEILMILRKGLVELFLKKLKLFFFY